MSGLGGSGQLMPQRQRHPTSSLWHQLRARERGAVRGGDDLCRPAHHLVPRAAAGRRRAAARARGAARVRARHSAVAARAAPRPRVPQLGRVPRVRADDGARRAKRSPARARARLMRPGNAISFEKFENMCIHTSSRSQVRLLQFTNKRHALARPEVFTLLKVLRPALSLARALSFSLSGG